jgi:hypothetical protein
LIGLFRQRIPPIIVCVEIQSQKDWQGNCNNLKPETIAKAAQSDKGRKAVGGGREMDREARRWQEGDNGRKEPTKTDYEHVLAFESFVSRRPWDIFISITFRHQTNTEAAIKMFKYFFKHLNSSEGIFSFADYIYCLVFFENNEYTNGIHLHVFLEGISPLLAKSLNRKCNDFFGDSDVVQYDPTQPATYYVSWKYVFGMLDHFDYYKINFKYRWTKKLY